jgi:uncharacterized membrane protein
MFETFKAKIQLSKMTVNAIMNKFDEETKAEAPVRALVMLLVLAILSGALIPTAINALKSGSNTTGTWSTSETATYGVISILIIVAVVLLVVRIATE